LETVFRTASHAVFAPDEAIISAVITLPALGALDRSLPARAPPHPTTQSRPSPATP
jgi:hypothetical protein